MLELAAQAGAWYVYQAVFDTSDYIRDRIERYHDHGIAVEGTILLGLDEHTEDDIKRLIDFLMEIELDLAEFTVLTPFPHTQAYADLKREDRILSFDWNDYSADKVVYQPRHMSPERLQELLQYAWDTFYAADEPADQDVQAVSAGGAQGDGGQHLPAARPRAREGRVRTAVGEWMRHSER